MNIVRDAGGNMILKIDNTMMASIIANVKGKFRQHRRTGQVVFEILDNEKLIHKNVEIFFWKGTLIFPNNG